MSHRTSDGTRLGVVRQYPLDMAIVTGAAALAYVAVTSLEPGTARFLAAVPILLFLPGYALVAVLFPARERDARTATGIRFRPRGVDATERIGLAFAVSLALVILLVVALPVTPWGLGLTTVAGGLGGGSVVLSQIGAVRRLRIPEPKRFTVSGWLSLERLRNDESGAISLSSVVLAVAVVVAVGSLLLGVVAPVSTGGSSELGLYTTGDDGELVAGDLPDSIGAGDAIPATVAIENDHAHDEEYTVVVQQQRYDGGAVADRTELEQFEASVAAGATATADVQLAPTAPPNETVRISVQLYDDGVPLDPTGDRADQETYVWVTVTEE